MIADAELLGLGALAACGAHHEVEDALPHLLDRLLAVDDRPENVEGALAAGWTAHLWQDDADTRAWLTELGVLAER